MDYIVLSVWSRVNHTTTTYPKLLLASLVGAIYSLIILLTRNYLNKLVIFCTYIFVSILLLYIVGLKGKIKDWVIGFLTFYITCFVLCGIMTLIMRESSSGNKLIIVSMLLYHVIPIVWQYVKKYVERKNLLYKVLLVKGKNKVIVDALFDTGNNLTDPYNGEIVSVVEKDVLMKIDISCNSCGGDITVGKADGIRLIPYKSVGKESGLIRVIKIDYMLIGGKRKIKHPELAVYEGTLSQSGNFRMILNEGCLR